MDTEVFGQIPIYSRQQIRRQYAKTVKANFDDPEKLVEVGVMPFPNDAELQSYDESVETGLNHAFRSIQEGDAAELPDFFMIDTEKRDAAGRGAVWVVAGGEVVDFTKTELFHESKMNSS